MNSIVKSLIGIAVFLTLIGAGLMLLLFLGTLQLSEVDYRLLRIPLLVMFAACLASAYGMFHLLRRAKGK